MFFSAAQQANERTRARARSPPALCAPCACFVFSVFRPAHDLLLLLISSHVGSAGGAGANEPLTQPSPAKPTWAQILNSNPNAPSSASASAANNNNTNNNNNTAGGNNSPSSSSPSSQHSTTAKPISPSASGTQNAPGSRPAGLMPSFYDQQQSQMNWPLNFNQTPSWMINDDESQRQANNSAQASAESLQPGGDGTRSVVLLVRRFSVD